LDTYLNGNHDRLAVIYETADPGKFSDDVEEAIGVTPDIPDRIAKQAKLKERIYNIDNAPNVKKDGSIMLSDSQYQKAKEVIGTIF